MKAGTKGVTKIVEEPKKYTLLAKSKEADKILYTRQSYTEFPDLWVTDLKFRKPAKLTDVNPQTAEFAWGDPELVEWLSVDGIPLQGILIKPVTQAILGSLKCCSATLSQSVLTITSASTKHKISPEECFTPRFLRPATEL